MWVGESGFFPNIFVLLFSSQGLVMMAEKFSKRWLRFGENDSGSRWLSLCPLI